MLNKNLDLLIFILVYVITNKACYVYRYQHKKSV